MSVRGKATPAVDAVQTVAGIVAPWLAEFNQAITQGHVQEAITALTRSLDDAPLGAWLACAPEVVRLSDPLNAQVWLRQALSRWPDAVELRYWLGRALWEGSDVARAQDVLREILAVQADHADATSLLASVLRSQGKLDAAVALLHGWCLRVPGNSDVTLYCATFIKQCQRQPRALQLCERELNRGSTDARVFALAANLALELGRFEQARTHALDALEHGVALNDWFVLQTLANAQRYGDARHPDFARFAKHLSDPALSARGRAAILFAHAKARDDIGDHAEAARTLRQANALAQVLTPWSRDAWFGSVAAEIAASRPARAPAPSTDPVPVFVVGLPRTGTTLVAELLGRHPQVCNRGELPFLAYVARQLAASGRSTEPLVLREAAAVYRSQLHQDDAPARWYIDKNPLNFRYLGLIAALFPNARIIHCRRNRRDTALSIWSQFFAHDDYGFANDFAAIAAFAQGHDQLMRHWRNTLTLPIHVLDYEDLAERPETAIQELQVFLGLEPTDNRADEPNRAITSASMWQARQPVYKSSVQRWRTYATLVPELLEYFPESG